MIKELTKEQQSQLSVYRDKWIKIGLSTQQIDLDKAIEIKNSIYSVLLNKKDVPVILMDSPLTAWIATLYLGNLFYGKQVQSQVRSKVESQVGSEVGSQVRSKVELQVSSQVESKVESQVWLQVRSQVESQVWSQVDSQVWSQVRSQVRSQVDSQVESQLEYFLLPYLHGQFDSSYFSFYDFIFEIIKIINPFKDLFNSYIKTTECGIIYPRSEERRVGKECRL